MDILPMDILPNRSFAERAFCRTDSLPNGQLAEKFGTVPHLSRNFGKLVKNLKEYKTKLYLTIIVSVIKIDNDFKRTYKVQKIISIFGKLSVRQTVRSVKCPFGKTSFGKVSFSKMSGHHGWV